MACIYVCLNSAVAFGKSEIISSPSRRTKQRRPRRHSLHVDLQLPSCSRLTLVALSGSKTLPEVSSFLLSSYVCRSQGTLSFCRHGEGHSSWTPSLDSSPPSTHPLGRPLFLALHLDVTIHEQLTTIRSGLKHSISEGRHELREGPDGRRVAGDVQFAWEEEEFATTSTSSVYE
jgi:hypothetical protein